jgi:hypothetical protein
MDTARQLSTAKGTAIRAIVGLWERDLQEIWRELPGNSEDAGHGNENVPQWNYGVSIQAAKGSS